MQATKGEISGTLPSFENGRLAFELWAVDLGGQEQLVESFEFTVTEPPKFQIDQTHTMELSKLDNGPAV